MFGDFTDTFRELGDNVLLSFVDGFIEMENGVARDR
jgi:hypothetical protein